jgi:hypothetical protein
VRHGAGADIRSDKSPVGKPFEQQDEQVVVSEGSERTASPELLTEANLTHRKLQNALAAELLARGISPLSPQSGDMPFDLAFFNDGRLVIV